jgi:CDP-diacylglycerol--serine O-phosphatidyltransferase
MNIKNIPNSITLLNLFCGCIAMVFVTTLDFEMAFLFCVWVSFLDFLMVFARLLKVSAGFRLLIP